MNVGELKELLKNVDDDMEVIVQGKNQLGMSIYDSEITDKGFVSFGGEIGNEIYPTFCLKVDTNVRNDSDIGVEDTYMSPERFHEYCQDDEYEEE